VDGREIEVDVAEAVVIAAMVPSMTVSIGDERTGEEKKLILE
jgi:hypothetical protein